MKKFIYFITAVMAMLFTANISNAQQRVRVGDGIYVVSYGNVTVIENDNTQQTVQIKIAEKSDNLYDIFCGNKYVKNVTKTALKKGIESVITASTGGTLTWLGKIAVGTVVDIAYDGVCNYFSK